MKWRRNRFSHKDHCQLCYSRFHRDSKHHHDDELLLRFSKQVRWAVQDRVIYKDKNIHSLDSCLNRRDYSSFLAILAFLISKDLQHTDLRLGS
jgi:hypothetical protein